MPIAAHITTYQTLEELHNALPGGARYPVWVVSEQAWYTWSGEIVTPEPTDTTPPIVSATPTPGTYTTVQNVTLSANEPATIYYTIDGSTPTVASQTYNNTPVNVSASTTIKYFAVDTAGNSSAVQTAAYTINLSDSTPPNPVTNLATGTITSSSVGISWTASTSGDVSGYEVATSTDGTNYTVRTTTAAGATSYTLSGLAAETAYTVRVVAIDTAGNRSAGVTVQGTTLSASPTGKVEDASLLLYQDNPVTKQTMEAADDVYFQNGDQWTAFATIKPVVNTNAATKLFSRLSPNAVLIEFTFDNHFKAAIYGKSANGTGTSAFPAIVDPATITDFTGFHHVAVVRDSTKMTLYVNGVSAGSVNVASDFWIDPSTAALKFGDNTQTNQPIFKNMGYYNRALSSAELTQNYNALK